MSKVAAIVLDIDGTLVSARHGVSDEDLGTLRACRERGIILYLATARPRHLVFRPGEAGPEADFLRDRGTFCSGARVVEEALSHRTCKQLSGEMVRRAVETVRDRREGLQVAIQRQDGSHAFRHPVSDDMLPGWGVNRDQLTDFELASQKPCLRLVFFRTVGGEDIRGLGDVLRERGFPEARLRISDSGLWMEMVAKDATKEGGILELLGLRDIAPERVVVFGNDGSDIGMFETFGVRVAMGNACPELKRLADQVTLSCEESGVSRGIQELLGSS